ncbi:hypothetical protein EJ110_NYTH51585 [Nymphaea thermarum]|nr:hypothetical protein EJ110_NYTH51585 [Nymphaea thermarum]
MVCFLPSSPVLLLHLRKCEIEANIGCCGQCPKDVEKYLKDVDGVESVDLYPEMWKVVVTGNVDPGVLLREVQKVKKKARILTRDGPIRANNLSAGGDEHDRDNKEDNKKKKKQSAHAVIPLKEEEPEKAITVYKPPKPSDGRGEVAVESKNYGLKLWAAGIGGVGLFYRWGKIYRNKEAAPVVIPLA